MKKIALIASCLGFLSISVFLLLCRDDAQVLVPTDISLYAVQPEGNEESFDILINVLRGERGFRNVPNELLRKDKTEDGYKDLLFGNSDIIIHNNLVAKEVLRELSPLDSFEAIGDTSSSYESEIVKFQTTRDLVRAICFYTDLSYSKDSKERDLGELLQLRAVMSKWLPHTRNLVHSMMAVIALNQIRDTLVFIEPHLNSDEVLQILTAYSNIPNYPRSIENALYFEYCMTADALDGVVADGKGGLGYLLIKQNRTLNIYGSYLREQIASSQDQDWDSMEKRSDTLEENFERVHLTNWGGWTFLAMVVPAMNNVFKQAYKAETEDLELIQKLQQAAGGDATR